MDQPNEIAPNLDDEKKERKKIYNRTYYIKHCTKIKGYAKRYYEKKKNKFA
jgi:DNA-dependent RNA polymerase auxiliary subunit epsilon